MVKIRYKIDIFRNEEIKIIKDSFDNINDYRNYLTPSFLYDLKISLLQEKENDYDKNINTTKL